MQYLETFRLSEQTVDNPNIYPYNVFARRQWPCLVFEKMTVLYGGNASGKSTLLNVIANALAVPGAENGDYNKRWPYFSRFVDECSVGLARGLSPESAVFAKRSRYIKSEDILLEVKKIQQEAVLRNSLTFERVVQKEEGLPLPALARVSATTTERSLEREIELEQFAQEKYSNGEQALMVFDDYIAPEGLYLLDEPEVSLSPQNQVTLAEKINEAEHYLGCQFIIATHSPLLLGTLNAKIYDLDSFDIETRPWTKLENVRYLYDFFIRNKEQFI